MTSAGKRESASGGVDQGEVDKFDRLAADWWDPAGTMKPLHRLNPVRLAYIRDLAAERFGRSVRAPSPFHGLSLLDIGCGGGLLSEPLARLGFDVTGIDPAGNNVEIARAHAEAEGVAVSYRRTTAQALVEEGASFDVVLAMEVVEHVPDLREFVAAAGSLLKPGGLFVGATINRTKRAFALAIVGAEFVLRWLPVGTHDWEKFVTPDEFADALRLGGVDEFDRTGVVYNPLIDRWSASRDTAVNYMIAGGRDD